MKFIRRIMLMLLLLCMALGATSCNEGDAVTKNNETESDTATVTEETSSETTNTVYEKIGINVMSFNCKGEFGTVTVKNASPTATANLSVDVRGPKLNKMLIGEKIDIVGFQEMKPQWQNWLKTSLNYNYAYVGGCTEKSQEGGYVAYLKDKYTVIEWNVFWLSDGAPDAYANSWGGDYDRICTWVLFQDNASEQYFLFVNTHLDTKWSIAGKGAELIVEQVKALRSKYQTQLSVSELPAIFVGDMNSEPTGDNNAAYNSIVESGVFKDALTVSKGEKISSLLSTAPDIVYCKSEENVSKNGHRIDHIFVTANIEVLHYRAVYTATNLCKYGNYMSDHNAVIAEILLPSVTD